MTTLMEKSEQEELALSPDERRFLLDLEFIQWLANPSYVQCTIFNLNAFLPAILNIKSPDNIFTDLASHEAKYMTDERFVTYLRYLQYFKSPKYSQYIQYVLLYSFYSKSFNLTLLLDTHIACLYLIFFWTTLSVPTCQAHLY